MPKFRYAFLLCALLACGAPTAHDDLGSLSLALSTEAGGKTYRLSTGKLSLKGPSTRQLSAEGDDPLTLTLPIGSYMLTLEDGWVLSRVDDDAMTPVEATLESQNPAQLVIGPGATTTTMLRFALKDGTPVEMAEGTLEVGVTLGEASHDGGAPTGNPCSHGLLVNEIDYEQVGADNAEFVEILNTAACAARLADVTLELVNGGDGKTYGRTALSVAGDELASGARLVVGHANVLAALPASVMRVQLGASGLQNGAPDAVRLMARGTLIDAVSYEGEVSGAAEGPSAAADEGEGSLSRCPDGFDAQDNSRDLRLVRPTPGASNACADSE